MKAPFTLPIRGAAALILCAALSAPFAGGAHAAPPQPLTAKAFFSLTCCAAYVSAADPSTPVPTVADAHFDRGLLMAHSNFGNASATFNMLHYPSYGVFTATAGMIDSSDPNIVETLKVTADGKLIYSHPFMQGQLAKPITVPLGKAQVINLEVDSVGDSNATGLLLADPTLLPAAATVKIGPSGPAANGATTLQLFSATATVGGQQTALITTAKNALVTVVIDYPNGDQSVIGSKRAGPDGRYAYSWTLPAGSHGTVHVTVDAANVVAQATFTVS